VSPTTPAHGPWTLPCSRCLTLSLLGPAAVCGTPTPLPRPRVLCWCGVPPVCPREKLKRVASVREREEGLSREQQGGVPLATQDTQVVPGAPGAGAREPPGADGRRTRVTPPRMASSQWGQPARSTVARPVGPEPSAEAASDQSLPGLLQAGGVYRGCSRLAGGGQEKRTSIDDFEIIKPISRGAFGRVFLVRKCATGDLFAIKVRAPPRHSLSVAP